ncbi:MAG: ATP synthase F1 subunit delta [Clostridia bacterium]|nr:ATP synthase F1 subunit delta [Clostridia bacterium]
MNEPGKEYGTALFALACEESEAESYGKALEKIKGAFLENPQYMDLLSSPWISVNERLEMLEAAFSQAVPLHVLSFLKLLCQKGRMPCLMEAMDQYAALLDASKRVSNVKVTSAVELTDEEKKKLTLKLEENGNVTVRAEYVTDPSLLGGLIIEIDGKMIDGSLRHRLQEIKEVMNT